MDRRQIAVKLVMDTLGLECSVDTFADRLVFQKAIYLVQAGGVDLGYYFQWHLKGPYSRSLAGDARAVCDKVGAEPREIEGWALDVATEEKLANPSHLVTGDESDRPSRLELLASVHYLIDRDQVPRDDVPGIRATLGLFDKQFSEDEIKDALGELENHGLIRQP